MFDFFLVLNRTFSRKSVNDFLHFLFAVDTVLSRELCIIGFYGCYLYLILCSISSHSHIVLDMVICVNLFQCTTLFIV